MTLTAGSLSQLAVGSTKDCVAATSASGGSTPYSYAWYRSTSSGFSPGSGNLISGATSLILNDSSLTAGTQYYYKMIVKDSAATPASASYSQLGVLTASNKLDRVNSLLFGLNSLTHQMGQFGSFAASSPLYTTDPVVIQSLSAWLEGWFGAASGSLNPCIEEMNGLLYVLSYMICCLMQQGIPEYNSATTYFIGALVNSNGKIYVSLTNSNTGNALTDSANWQSYGGAVRTVTAAETCNIADDFIRLDAAAGNFTETLPPAAYCYGKKITLKNVNYANSNYPTVKGNGSENINGAQIQNTFDLFTSGDSVTVMSNGQGWDII